jgi:AbrB family looped-hinge helix DNA binding protein
MELVKIQNKYQITLPKAVRDSLGLKVGDYIEIDKSGERIVLKPVSVISKVQKYFHTTKWQKKEAEADKDIERGDVSGPFDNIKEAIADLKE